MLYFAINQPKFFVSYFSETYLSLIMVRDYRYFVICCFIVAVFIAVLSLPPCDCAVLVVLSISEISLYCFLSIWGSIFYQQILLDKNIKRHCVK